MEKIELYKGSKENLRKVAKAFKRKQKFVIVTADPEFNPLGNDRHSAEFWVGTAGGGFLMMAGVGMVILAFIDPEPTSKLTVLSLGGVIVTLSGGGIFYSIIISRKNYSSTVSFDPATKKYEWILTPNS